jgi:hypothetical protein
MYLVPGADTIIAQVKGISDLLPRRVLAAENVPREDLSPLERIETIVHRVDAELIEDVDSAAFADAPAVSARYGTRVARGWPFSPTRKTRTFDGPVALAFFALWICLAGIWALSPALRVTGDCPSCSRVSEPSRIYSSSGPG